MNENKMEKSFIRHTRPTGNRQIKQTIDDINKQINYWKAIGKHNYEIEYWSKVITYYESRLNKK